jgi:hypothetical protein
VTFRGRFLNVAVGFVASVNLEDFRRVCGDFV